LGKGKFTTFVEPSGGRTEAWGINNREEIVGFYIRGAIVGLPVHGFLTGKGAFTTIDIPGTVETTPRGSMTTDISSASIVVLAGALMALFCFSFVWLCAV